MSNLSHAWVLLLSLSASALQLSLDSALEKAGLSSSMLKSNRASANAAQSARSASLTKLLPMLSLEGNYYYQTNVPTVSFPGAPPGQLFTAGSHNNYTIGPVLRYTLFDGIQGYQNYKSADFMAQSKLENVKSFRRDLAFSVKVSYFKAQLAYKNLQVVLDNLKLAQAQSRDIDLRFKAGASSKLDQYAARRDVTNYQLKSQQAKADLSMSLRDLLAWIGEPTQYDIEDIQLDPQHDSLISLSMNENAAPDAELPQIKSLTLAAKAYEVSAKAQQGSLWPRIDFMAKSQLIYPNMIEITQAWQNTFLLNLTFPLWLGDASWNLSAQKFREATATRYQSEQKLSDLNRDYLKASDLAESLRTQKVSNKQFVQQTEQITQLTFESYKAGKVNYLDVQTSNMRLLEAKLAEAKTDEQLLIQLATLEYLSSSTGDRRE